MKKLLLAMLSLCIVAPIFAQQTFFLPGFYRQQLFNNNGQPLAGGFVYTCQSGTTCPGTPQPTYTDWSGAFLNSNPVQADATGYVSIWLDQALTYKFVITDASNVTIETIDRVTSAGSSSSGDTLWTLSGSTIQPVNSGVGLAIPGGGLTVGANVTTQGVIFNDSQLPPNTATLTGPLCFGTTPAGGGCNGQSVSWRLPQVDAAGCLTSDGMGNLSFVACGGGSSTGSGIPGTPVGAVQVAGTGNVFVGNANFTYAASTGSLVINSAASGDAGLIVTTGGVQADYGFNAINNNSNTTPLPWNIIQAPYGGMYANSVTAQKYMEMGLSNGVPTKTLNEASFPNPGSFYCDDSAGSGSGNCTPKVYNGSAWVSLDTGGATSPGGANCNVQFSSSGVFGGSSHLTFNCPTDQAANQLTNYAASTGVAGIVSTSYFQTPVGILVQGTGGQAFVPSWQNINVGGGGVYAQTVYATNYIVSGSNNGNPAPFGGQPAFSPTIGLGALTCNSSSTPCVEQYWNGQAWIPWGGGSTGGGVGSAGANAVLFNLGGSVNGSSANPPNFTYKETTSPAQNIVNVIGVAGTAGLNVTNGFYQATGPSAGFLALNCSQGTCFNAPSGGITTLDATFGGANGQFPSTVQVLGSGASSSQYASIWLDTNIGAKVWGIGVDSLGTGGKDFFLSSAVENSPIFAMSASYATGNVGFSAAPGTSPGQTVVIGGVSGLSALTIPNGFATIAGGLYVSTATGLNSVKSLGGFLANEQGSGLNCAFAIGNTSNPPADTNTTCVIGLLGSISATNIVTQSFTCTGSPCPGSSSGGTPNGGTGAVQYEVSGSTFGGSGGFTYNPTGVNGGPLVTINGTSATADSPLVINNGFMTASGVEATGQNPNSINNYGGYVANQMNSLLGGTGGCAYAVYTNCIIYGNGQFQAGIFVTGNSGTSIAINSGNLYTRAFAGGSTNVTPSSCTAANTVAQGWFAVSESAESFSWNNITFSNVLTAVFCIGNQRYRVPLINY